MASSRRTYDTDFITLRTVYAQNSNNVKIPALYALVADGSGGTRWSIPSSFATNPSFNQIIHGGLLPFAFTKDGNADVVLSWIHILTAGLHCANSML
jgi:hypothetical protein